MTDSELSIMGLYPTAGLQTPPPVIRPYREWLAYSVEDRPKVNGYYLAVFDETIIGYVKWKVGDVWPDIRINLFGPVIPEIEEEVEVHIELELPRLKGKATDNFKRTWVFKTTGKETKK